MGAPVSDVKEYMMNTGGTGAPPELAEKVRRYKAHITCANTMLNLRQVPHLLDNVSFAVAVQMAASDQVWQMEELSAEIEMALDGLGCDEAAQAAAGFDLQAKELRDEIDRFSEDMERRMGPEACSISKDVWFYVYYIYAKAALAAIQEVHYEFLAGEYPPEMVGIPERVIVRMMSETYGSDEAINEFDPSEVPVNPVTERMRAEIKESIAEISRILDLMHRVK